jgi:hypothetical protein
MPNSRGAALQVQAAYYIATGAWPLISPRTFERVTGPKADWWLVQMVGLLAASIGLSLAAGAHDERPPAAMRTLGVLCAFSFAGIDTVHALRGRISKIYLADAVLELVFVAALVC